MQNIYQVFRPENPLPLVFDSPHSGRIYPEDFNHSCDDKILQRAEDNVVDELFDCAPRYSAAFLCALFPRTYIDVNRAADDIDPDLLEEDWPEPYRPSKRSHSGIGLIRRVVRPGIPLYDRKLSVAEVKNRLNRYYHPYHEALEQLIEEAHYNFGQVWHINCHSMPSMTGIPRLPRGALPMLYGQPDFVLGDRDGTSCNLAFTHALRDYLKKQGFKVTINNPYRGVECVRRYSSPSTGRHSIQIEINKALYWDEHKGRKNKKFKNFKNEIEKLVSFCADYTQSQLIDMAAD